MEDGACVLWPRYTLTSIVGRTGGDSERSYRGANKQQEKVFPCRDACWLVFFAGDLIWRDIAGEYE
jgi:hypothetical protein